MGVNSTKKTIYHFHSLARVLIVPAVLVACNILVAPFVLRWDLTASRQYTLGEATRRVLRELQNPITIEVFFSQDIPQELIGIRQDTLDVVGEYQRLGKGKVLVEQLDPQNDSAAAAEAESLGIPKVDFNTSNVQKIEISSGYAGIAVRYLEKSEPLPVISATTNLEYDLTLAIRRLTREKVPQIGLPTSHGEQLDPQVRQELEKEYGLTDVTLDQGQVVPAVDGILIVAPTAPYTATEQFALDQFIMNGGKLIALIDGTTVDDQQLTAQVNQLGGLTDLLAAYGVTVNPDVVADGLSAEYLPFQTGNGRGVWIPYTVWPKIIHPPRAAWIGLNPDHPITAKLNSLTLPWPSSLTIRPDAADQITVLGESSPQSTATNLTTAGQPFALYPQALPKTDGAGSGQQVVAALIHGKLSSAFAGKPLPEGFSADKDKVKMETDNAGVMVVGSGRFIGLNILQRFSPENFTLVGNGLDALLQDASLIAIRSRTSVDRPLKSVSNQEAAAIRYGNIFGGSVLVIAAGLVAIGIRKRSTARAIRRYRSA
ncbi:MAG: Gldg family protein [Patescibacteria group bacterium]|nr:Gldg family protein [Patescibacteria group bacterium]